MTATPFSYINDASVDLNEVCLHITYLFLKELVFVSGVFLLALLSYENLHLLPEVVSKGWQIVKSETRRDAETLVRNPSPRLFGKKFRDSKKVKTNHAKTRLRDLLKTLPRFRGPVKIFRDPRFSRYHSPPLIKSLFTGMDSSSDTAVSSTPLIYSFTVLYVVFLSV